MPRYQFKAKNEAGELVQGFRTSASERELVTSLRAEHLVVFFVQAASEEQSAVNSPVPSASRTVNVKQKKNKSGAITYKDIAVFCRQLATLINAGVSILDAIEDVAGMVTNQNFSIMLKKIGADIREGATLSEAMKKHQKVFGNVFTALIAAGEKGGQLGKVLLQLALYQEGIVRLRSKIKSASSYPMFVSGFFGVAIFGLVFFLIPRFKVMFAQFGAELPLPTRIVVGISDTMIRNIPIVLLITGGIIAWVVMTYKTPKGAWMFDRLKLQMPLFGGMIQKIVLARYFQTLATLIKSGNDIVSSLEIAGRAADNVYVQSIVEDIKQRVIEGATLSDEMAKHGVFPPLVVRMTAVGEKSGQLDEMFIKLSQYYSDEVDEIVNSMSAIIEPVLIVGLGLVVGVFIVTMYLPIFKMASAVMNQ